MHRLNVHVVSMSFDNIKVITVDINMFHPSEKLMMHVHEHKQFSESRNTMLLILYIILL